MSLVETNEEIYGEYQGIVNLVDIGEKGPWALLDAEQIDNSHNTPMVQIKLNEKQYTELSENDEVTFKLGPAEQENDEDAYIIYNDNNIQPRGIHITELKKICKQ